MVDNQNYLTKTVLGHLPQAELEIKNALVNFDNNFNIFLNNLISTENFVTEKYDNILLIGIGGSNLFAQAITELLNIDKVKFLDALDINNIQAAINLLDLWLSQKTKFAIFIVSKSGTTLEIIVNSSVIIDYLKSKTTSWADYLKIISDPESELYSWGKINNISCYPITPGVGGRFSFLTAAGLLPLAACGVEISKIKNGAEEYLAKFRNHKLASLNRVINTYAAYKSGLNLFNLFVFNKSFYLGQWYRQLFAESLVKNNNISLVPTVSTVVDLHSMSQLYFAGKDQWFTTFLVIENNKDIKVKKLIFDDINTDSYRQVQKSLFTGVCQGYQAADRSYQVINIDDSLEAVGGLCMSWIIEVLIFSMVLEVNPFDQPAVEYYKNKTKQILKD